MDVIKEKGRKGLIFKTWERCRSLGRGGGGSGKRSTGFTCAPILTKSKSLPNTAGSSDEDKRKTKRQVAPEGCFSVYVGTQKQRFVIKTEYANHPLFKMLLEEAELEYGYNSEGPLVLPCDVDLFYKVLMEMDSVEIRQARSFAKGYGSYHLLSPSTVVAMNRI